MQEIVLYIGHYKKILSFNKLYYQILRFDGALAHYNEYIYLFKHFGQVPTT